MIRYLRFYIKFQGYMIATMCILASILATHIMFENEYHYDPLEEFYDYRYMGYPALIFGLIWLSVGVMMFYGIYKEVRKFIYPFIVMFMFDLFLLFCRDMYLVWSNAHYYNMALLTPEGGIAAFLITMHVMTTVLALGRLIEHDPQSTQGRSFISFRKDSRHDEPTYNEVFGHETAAVIPE